MENDKKTSSTYFFYKSVLRKVSFDAVLFKKELKKGLLHFQKEKELGYTVGR